MPIVDGLTSTKMIRSFEKSHSTHLLSPRALLNGRVPIIAVSASLVERERQTYIDTGFDGWILKPISFNRLSEIMKGIVDADVRKNNLYRPGAWEHGGWFHEAQKDVFAADTRPSGGVPLNQVSDITAPEGVKVAAASDDPFVKEEDPSEQTQEQMRLADVGAPKASSMPEPRHSAVRAGSSEETVTQSQIVATPPPIDES
jgi:CheY-like chemotaxis protein